MFVELAVAAGVTYALDKYRNREFNKEEKIFRNTCMILDKSFLIINSWITPYGNKFLISLKNKEYTELEKLKGLLETNFAARVEIEQNETMSSAYVYVIKRRLNDKEFKFTTYKCKPNEIYLGLDNKLEPIVVNMNTFPHILLSGTTGSGKSEELRIILSNLISNNTSRDIELYFSNISLSNDFYQFLNCNQVKGYVEEIQESLQLFRYLNYVYEKRLSIFRSRNCIDIKEYNKKFNEKRMTYIYLCIDEFADYFPANQRDNLYDLKIKCYNELRQLSRKARKAGIFLVVAIQRPDTTVLDPSLRSNLCTKIGFYQNNDASSLTVCDTVELTKIREREFLAIYGNKKFWSRSLYISKNIVYENIKKSLVKNRQKKDDFNDFLKDNKFVYMDQDNKKNRDKIIDKPKPAKKVAKQSTKKEKTKIRNVEILKIS